MRAAGFFGLLIALVIVALLAIKKTGTVSTFPATGQGDVTAFPLTPAQQSLQFQQQIKQSVEGSLRQPSAGPDQNN